MAFRRALSRFTRPFEGPYRDLQGPLKGPIKIYTALRRALSSFKGFRMESPRSSKASAKLDLLVLSCSFLPWLNRFMNLKYLLIRWFVVPACLL